MRRSWEPLGIGILGSVGLTDGVKEDVKSIAVGDL